eukprot:309054-Alexandrium_andersonii.AAC.1
MPSPPPGPQLSANWRRASPESRRGPRPWFPTPSRIGGRPRCPPWPLRRAAAAAAGPDPLRVA